MKKENKSELRVATVISFGRILGKKIFGSSQELEDWLKENNFDGMIDRGWCGVEIAKLTDTSKGEN